MYWFPEVKRKQMLPSRMYCKLSGGTDHRAQGWPQRFRMGQKNWFFCARVAGLYEDRTRFTILMLCFAVTKYSIQIQHDKYFPCQKIIYIFLSFHNEGQWAPAPGFINFKCQTLAIPLSFISLIGSLCCKALSKDCSCKKGSDKPKSCGSVSIRNRPATQKTPKSFFTLVKSYSRQKRLKTSYPENNHCTRRNPSQHDICSMLLSGQSSPGIIKKISAHVAQSIFSFSTEALGVDPIYDLLTCGMGLRPPIHFTGASEQLLDGNGFPSPVSS